MKKTGSKFKYLEGRQAAGLNECYGGLRVGVCSADSCILKANRTLFALPWSTAGTIAVQPLEERGNGRDDRPLVVVEDGGVCQDLDWSPFDDGLLASAWEDGAARLHRIPTPAGLQGHLIDASATLKGHEKRLNVVAWHSYVNNVLLTADTGKEVKLWDVEAGAEKVSLQGLTRTIANATWSQDCNLVAVSSKDKTMRVFDARSGANVNSAASHQGAKGGRVTWLGRLDRICTVGFNRQNVPELVLIDPRNVSAPLQTVNLGSAPSTLFPSWDDDLGLLYLGGKGEGSIKVVEVSESEAAVIAEHKSKDPQAALALLPKQGVVNAQKCEVARFLKLIESRRLVAPLFFEVPRSTASTVFQEDLYPPVWDGRPTLNAADFFSGTQAPAPTRVAFIP
eukprot:m51a1_g4181 hypothetical protein (395) ;mRNA; f:363084-364567